MGVYGKDCTVALFRMLRMKLGDISYFGCRELMWLMPCLEMQKNPTQASLSLIQGSHVTANPLMFREMNYSDATVLQVCSSYADITKAAHTQLPKMDIKNK